MFALNVPAPSPLHTRSRISWLDFATNCSFPAFSPPQDPSSCPLNSMWSKFWGPDPGGPRSCSLCSHPLSPALLFLCYLISVTEKDVVSEPWPPAGPLPHPFSCLEGRLPAE